MRILLGSGGFRGDERVQRLQGEMQAFFGSVTRVLFIPYAGADYDGYVERLTELGLNAGYELDPIHRHPDAKAAVAAAEAIYVGGGNSFRLLHSMIEHDLLTVVRARVQEGLPYLGISAGANLACPTIKTTNDMPIILPPTLDALGLVPFQLNPHYYSGHFFLRDGDRYQEHFGETRDDRITEFHQLNTTPVLGLWEGGLLRVTDDTVTLVGTAARLFRRGAPASDLAPSTTLPLSGIAG